MKYESCWREMDVSDGGRSSRLDVYTQTQTTSSHSAGWSVLCFGREIFSKRTNVAWSLEQPGQTWGLRLGPGTGRNRLEWNTFHYSGTGSMVFWPWCWYPSQTINLITRTDWYNRSCWSFEIIQFICYSNLCGFDWRRWLVLIIPCCVRFPPVPQFDCDWWDVRCNITFLHTLTSLPHLHHLSRVLRDKTQLK